MMIIRDLYRIEREGSVIFTMEKPTELNYELNYRLIPSEGMKLTLNGVDTYSVIDVESPEGWYEVPAPESTGEQIYHGDLSPQGDLYTEFLASRGIPTA